MDLSKGQELTLRDIGGFPFGSSDIPTLLNNNAWTYDNKLYQYAGRYGDPELVPEEAGKANKLDIIDVKSRKLRQIEGTEEGRRYRGGSAQSATHGFYLGGQADSFTKPKSTGVAVRDTLAVFDFKKEEFYYEKVDITGTRDLSLSYISSVGKHGVLVAIGGLDKNNVTIPYDTVNIYDLASKKWFSQSTRGAVSGDIPPDRVEQCSILVSEADNSQHYVYVYGGLEYPDVFNPLMDSLHILSIPSFTWRNISGVPKFPQQVTRKGLSCTQQGRYFITIGGELEDPNKCDDARDDEGKRPVNKGRRAFDMEWLRWAVHEDWAPAAFKGIEKQAYESHNISTNATAPSFGWDDPDLAEIFKARSSKDLWVMPAANKAPADVKSPNSGSSGNSNNGGDESPSGSSTNQKLGLILGVVLGIAAILGIVLFILHRRRQARKNNPSSRTVELEGNSPGVPPYPNSPGQKKGSFLGLGPKPQTASAQRLNENVEMDAMRRERHEVDVRPPSPLVEADGGYGNGGTHQSRVQRPEYETQYSAEPPWVYDGGYRQQSPSYGQQSPGYGQQSPLNPGQYGDEKSGGKY